MSPCRAGAALWSDMGLGLCGAGFGALATADAKGRVRVDDFYPEEWLRFWICADRKEVWASSDNGRLPRTIDVSVTPSGAKRADSAKCGS